MWALQPMLRRKLARRGQQEPGYLEAVPERFGHYSQPPSSGWVWVHAVSLGESRAAGILIQALRSEWAARGWPFRLLLTHGTATGRAEGARWLREGDVQVWQPWDTPAAVRRFVQHFRPALGILMETEVWPNLIAACRQAGVPLALANARLNEKSLKAAQRLSSLSLPAYQGLSAVWAQGEDDARRLRQLGAPVQAVLGNLKFDAEPDAGQLAQAKALVGRWLAAPGSGSQGESHRVPVLMLASSREGEEQAWLAALQRLRAASVSQGVPAFRCLVVPRHPQRFDEVADLIAGAGFALSRRSQWGDLLSAQAPPADALWLGDSLGEMAFYYGLASVALLGGSFAPLGGQNLIEPIACGCPVVMGPHTFNFADAARLAQEAGAAVRVSDMAAGVAAALDWVGQGERYERAVQQTLAFAQAHRGAARRTATAAAALLSPT